MTFLIIRAIYTNSNIEQQKLTSSSRSMSFSTITTVSIEAGISFEAAVYLLLRSIIHHNINYYLMIGYAKIDSSISRKRTIRGYLV